MSLISERPQHWNQVIGQERAIKTLHSILRTPQYQTRGYILEGPYAVGKTSVAYLLAKALMCKGDDPLGCGKCFSCDTSIYDHGAFREVDAASCSGVAQTRQLMEEVSGPCTAAKRHVVVIDEAHQLSPEAFDVFLKPLELDDLGAVFIFVTSQGNKIPDTIASRCAIVRFNNISLEAMTGHLVSLADREGIKHTAEGIRSLAKHTNGRLRDAAKNLGLVAAVGPVTPENVEAVLNYGSTMLIESIYQNIIDSNFTEAVAKGEELSNLIGPSRVVQAMFSAYSRDIFGEGRTSKHFVSVKEVNTLFIRWLALPNMEADILHLFILELYELRSDIHQNLANNKNAPPPSVRAAEYMKNKPKQFVTPEQVRALLKAS